ncbi:MAG TPA: valine--tRNA ligase [Natronosporangium sp.]
MRNVELGDFDHQEIEAAARALWEQHDVYRYDRTESGPVFSVDTPPAYVSAAHLHVGHAMSYSQPDFVVRYRRMRGERVFYPMGFDDNGLPTERYVEQTHGVKAVDMPRAEFVALCLAETSRTTATYERLWRRLGLSVDWSLRYSTIDERCRRVAQLDFLKLYRAGHIRRAEDPILWCPECRTALAQADVEDLTRTSKLHRISFGDGLVIATTRPELLPACVALYANPADPRYQSLIGGTATVPLFGQEVPIRTDDAVDPEFGTGLMMVCTFGDGDDVLKWRRDKLELRLVIGGDGRLGELAGGFAGLPVTQARARIVERLAETGALLASDPISQTVGVHERCQTPIEFQLRPQWFVGITEHREAFRRRAHELVWVPEFMRRRLLDWIDGLKWDWNLSRQRYYGTPFPVWFCGDCGFTVLADEASLPVDPLTDPPPVAACPACGGSTLEPDQDVMDTWMTSSLTPQINQLTAGDDPALAPMSLRVQAFEIIRTWLFYTLVQSQLRFDRLPWRAVMVSGWGLNEQGRKIAKRDLAAGNGFNRYDPAQVIDRYGADALRLWATKARIGSDLRYHEKDVRAGRKFAVKLWNVARFVTERAGGTADDVPVPERTAVDRWLLSQLAETVDEVTAAFDEYDVMRAHQAAARCFWSIYCDRYIEMVKDRFRFPEEHSEADRASARATLRESLRVLLGLFAPFAPFVTEHLYQQLYRPDESAVSLHLTSWPVVPAEWRTDRSDVDQLVIILDQVRALRSRLRLGAGARLSRLVLHASTPEARRLLTAIAEPLRTAARAESVVEGEPGHDSGVPGITVDVVR